MAKVRNLQHAHRILKKHGLSVCEYSVLDILRLRIPASPLGIAKYAKDYDKNAYGNPFGAHSLKQYREAVESCFEKGLLMVLTTDEFKDAVFSAPTHKSGNVEFTEKGYRLYKRLLAQMGGQEFQDETKSSWNWNETKNCFEVYAISKKDCLALLKDISTHVERYLGRPGKRTKIRGPEGPFKAYHFESSPKWFRGLVKVQFR
jgi:hypothetical protein